MRSISLERKIECLTIFGVTYGNPISVVLEKVWRSLFAKAKKHLMKNDKDYPDMPGLRESQPRISLVIPFELKMLHEKGLSELLMSSADKIENELRASYSEERTTPVIKKLRHLMLAIHCPPHNQSIAIFVSPLTERVYYFTGTLELNNYYP